MKASRGCENLKAQAVEIGMLNQKKAAALSRETPKGKKPQGKRRGWTFNSLGVLVFGKPKTKRRLGAWKTSEEEPKPMRGILELLK
jgi:hypothetical protein